MGALGTLALALALLAGARPTAASIPKEQDSQDAPVVELLDALSAYVSEPWAPAGAAPAPASAIGALNATALQDYVGDAPPSKTLRGIGLYGPNIPNELAVFSRSGLKWYYTWECAPRRLQQVVCASSGLSNRADADCCARTACTRTRRR